MRSDSWLLLVWVWVRSAVNRWSWSTLTYGGFKEKVYSQYVVNGGAMIDREM
jgi:hypothetical protein